MRVCDRHNDQKATSSVVLTDTQEKYDLCEECLQQIRDFVGGVMPKLEKKKKGIVDRIKDSVLTE